LVQKKPAMQNRKKGDDHGFPAQRLPAKFWIFAKWRRSGQGVGADLGSPPSTTFAARKRTQTGIGQAGKQRPGLRPGGCALHEGGDHAGDAPYRHRHYRPPDSLCAAAVMRPAQLEQADRGEYKNRPNQAHKLPANRHHAGPSGAPQVDQRSQARNRRAASRIDGENHVIEENRSAERKQFSRGTGPNPSTPRWKAIIADNRSQPRKIFSTVTAGNCTLRRAGASPTWRVWRGGISAAICSGFFAR